MRHRNDFDNLGGVRKGVRTLSGSNAEKREKGILDFILKIGGQDPKGKKKKLGRAIDLTKLKLRRPDVTIQRPSSTILGQRATTYFNNANAFFKESTTLGAKVKRSAEDLAKKIPTTKGIEGKSVSPSKIYVPAVLLNKAYYWLVQATIDINKELGRQEQQQEAFNEQLVGLQGE